MNRARVEFPVVVFEEVTDQLRDVGGALAQRWHVEIDHVDAIKQVGAEVARSDFLFQLSIRRADHANFHLFVFLCADAAELAILKQLQQLRLQAHIELGDFIEE